MYQEDVRFDKDSYQPGDQITAQVVLLGPFEDNLRKIEIRMGGYIKTHTTSSDADGDIESHYEEVVICETKTALPHPTPGESRQLNLLLPTDLPPDVEYEDHNKIEYLLHIKYDLSLARDNHSHYTIPLVIQMPSPHPQSLNLGSQDLACSVPTNEVAHNQPFLLEITRMPEIKFRSFRIEFCREIWMEADEVEDTDFDCSRIYQDRIPPSEPISVIIPGYDLRPVDTITFKIKYYLKLVIDIAFARDINLEIPVIPKFS